MLDRTIVQILVQVAITVIEFHSVKVDNG